MKKEKKDFKYNIVEPKKRKKALEKLKMIFDRPDKALIIHYSCESFYKEDVSSPRITAIAVRNLESAQTHSFTIHKEAEIAHLNPEEIDKNYDELELKMLNKFFEFVASKSDCKWVHWNMRDGNYGFQAIEHRHIILGGHPHTINDEMKIDLARMLIAMYGIGYIEHPRLESIIAKNKITDKNLLKGSEEATAFDHKNFLALQMSTLRKVDCMSNILERMNSNTLKTNSTWWQIHGGSISKIIVDIQQNWICITIIMLVSMFASILGIIGFFASK